LLVYNLEWTGCQQVEMEDTSMDIMEEKSAEGNGNGNGAADTASQDDDDDVEPPVNTS